jgi:hypothetical protein
VESGSLRLSLRNKEHVTIGKGELFGEIAVINDSLRTGSIRAIEKSTLIAFDREKFRPHLFDPTTTLKIVIAMARRLTNLLRSQGEIATTELIKGGEDELVEFKSTLRWNLYTNKKDKAIEHAALKTVAAFMNTSGGTLLVGVADDGELLGLENDKFPNDDRMLLHLNKLIQTHISTLHTEFIDAEIELVEGKKVLRIDCIAGGIPAYVSDGNDEDFYIRTGPSTTSLPVSKVYDYIKRRFH